MGTHTLLCKTCASFTQHKKNMALVAARAGRMALASVAQGARCMSAAAAADPHHDTWMKETVAKYAVKDIPNFEFSVEFLLGIPVPHHQFEQPPILVEVANRNADLDMGH